jgi:hypothetical protein
MCTSRVAFIAIHLLSLFRAHLKQTYVPILPILVIVHDILIARGGGSHGLSSTRLPVSVFYGLTWPS